MIEPTPEEFCSPFSSGAPGTTSFVAVVGPSTIWPGAQTITSDDITDGAWQTIFIVEIADSDIAWTEPRDLPIDRVFDRKPAANRLYNEVDDGRTSTCTVGFNHVRHMPPICDRQLIRALLTRNAGDSTQDFEW